MARTAGRQVAGLCIVIACAVLMCGTPAFALNPALDVSQYAHTAWKIRDGFGTGLIRAIAQTPDGYLWLATESGLLRFDGVRNLAWQPPPGQSLPSSEINNLLAARDGSLWIATAKGLAVWKDGRLTQVAQLAGQIVFPLLEDREGAVWAGTIALNDARLCAVHRSAAQCDGGGGRFGHAVVGLYEDSTGAIWVSVNNGLWRWRPGPPEFHPMPDAQDGTQSFDEEAGWLLLGTINGVRRLVGRRAEAYPVPGAAGRSRVGQMLRDRDGGLWIGTRGQGVVHVHQGRTDIFTLAHGLSGDSVTAIFEDREGSIWVATGSGLDRFRDLAISTSAAGQGLSSARVLTVLGTRDGGLWVGTDLGVDQRKGTRFTTALDNSGRPGGTPLAISHSLFQDSRGRIWISTPGGLGYVEHGRYISQPGIPDTSVVRAMAEDAGGDLWVALQDDGLFRVSRSGTTEHVTWATLGRRDFATALAADPVQGGLWIGFQNGGVVYFNDGQARASYTAAGGLGEGRVSSLRFDRDGALWAGTESGLSRIRSGRVGTLTTRNGLPCNAVHWTIDDDAASVWLYMSCGLVRIPVSELAAWAADVDTDIDRARTVQNTVFDSSDGAASQAVPLGYSPRVAKSADGVIWFVAQDGLAAVDPQRLPVNRLPPPVFVEQVTANRTTYAVPADSADLRLPALIRDLQIDYTALSLVAPEKMRFRYKLEGRDSDWQDVGTRRQAFYTDLSPGRYRFRVMASNNSGVWNEAGASLDFAVAPAFYQTAWFLALSAGVVVGLAWAAHRVRLRMVETHEREITALNERLMKAQEQERIRIAGELHDGVMQQMLAATMMLGTAKRRIPDELEAKAALDKIQDKLIQVGTDIRQLSHGLHPPMLQDAGLPQAMRSYCEEFSASCGVPVLCEADEDARDLSRGAALALYRIVQEALGNAAKHANARRITVRLTRTNGMVSLTVSDDGIGFDRSRLVTSGGLGLITMRERAGQLNGTFEFDSTPGRGTTIRVVIPFR